MTRSGRWAAIAVFAAYLLAGLSLFRSYGVPWDEPVERDYGRAVFEYVVHGDRQVLQERIRLQGPLIEFTYYAAERGLGLTDSRDVYFMRHLANFLLFVGGLAAFFVLVRNLFGSVWLGLLGSALVFVHPRLFADAFYNSKDIPFLTGFIVCALTLTRFVERTTVRNGMIHGAACALLVVTRTAGLILPLMTLLWFATDRRLWSRPLTRLRPMSAYAAVLAAGILLLWPTLWHDPMGEFVAALRENSAFPFLDTVRYFGQDLAANALPWHYLPVWIAITTPPLVLVLALVGALIALGSVALRMRAQRPVPPAVALSLLWVGVPLALMLGLRPVLYDGWRHMFFVFPGLALLAVVGIDRLWSMAGAVTIGAARAAARSAIAATTSLTLAAGVWVLVALHPLQCVYFSPAVGGIAGIHRDFDLDYWGLSYRQGLEHILRVDPSPAIAVYAAQEVGPFNAGILPAADRARLRFVDDPNQATYLMTNFRWDRAAVDTMGDPFFAVVVDHAEVLVIRKRRP